MSAIVLDWAAAAAAGTARAGGKGWQLGMMAELGLPVPSGFVIDSTIAVDRRSGDALSSPLTAALADALESRGWTDLPLAVRSSADAEDSAFASFAGIHRSILNVRGHAALIDAIRDVLDSNDAAPAVAYRERLGLQGRSRMAVVVMPLLPAVASGVAFTCDPISGRQDQWVIHAHWGLGESLVGGLVDADEYRLQVGYPDGAVTLVDQRRGAKSRMTVENGDRGTRQSDTPDGLASRSVLSRAQAVEIGTLAREVADVLDYAMPCYDIEWVWDGNRFWIVQARPVTARGRSTYPALMHLPSVWSRANSRDVVPDPLPALDRSVSLPLIDHMLTRSAVLAGYATWPGVQRTALHHGRLYFETSVLQWEAHDGFDVPPATYNRLLGGHQPEIPVPRSTIGARLRRAWRGMNFLRRSLWPRLHATSTLTRSHAAAAALLAQSLPDDPSALAERLLAQVVDMRRAEDLLLLQASGSALLVLLDLLEKYFPGEGGALAAALMAGGEPSTTAAFGYGLMRLARIAAADTAALEWLKSPGREGRDWRQCLAPDSSFGHAFATFLRDYGHRAVYESYLHHPRWRENPDYLLDTVAGLIDSEGAVHGDRQRDSGTTAHRRIRERLPVWHRPTIRLLVRLAIAERNMREGARSALTAHSGVVRRLVRALGEHWTAAGHLPSADEVFHLTLSELDAAANGRLAMPHAARRAEWRRRQHVAFTAQPAPELIVESDGRLAAPPTVANPSRVAGADEWRGIVVASGRANGSAHIAHHPSEALSLTAGAILVVPATDPSWIPAFLKAGAIVMETGGYLSHGAIVAREFGIPAVANLPGILHAIRAGDRLDVDANRGVVRRL